MDVNESCALIEHKGMDYKEFCNSNAVEELIGSFESSGCSTITIEIPRFGYCNCGVCTSWCNASTCAWRCCHMHRRNNPSKNITIDVTKSDLNFQLLYNGSRPLLSLSGMPKINVYILNNARFDGGCSPDSCRIHYLNIPYTQSGIYEIHAFGDDAKALSCMSRDTGSTNPGFVEKYNKMTYRRCIGSNYDISRKETDRIFESLNLMMSIEISNSKDTVNIIINKRRALIIEAAKCGEYREFFEIIKSIMSLMGLFSKDPIRIHNINMSINMKTLIENARCDTAAYNDLDEILDEILVRIEEFKGLRAIELNGG